MKAWITNYSKINKREQYILGCCFLFGWISLLLAGRQLVSVVGFMDTAALTVFAKTNIQNMDYLRHLLLHYAFVLAFLFAGYRYRYGRITCDLYLLYVGVKFGVMLQACMMQYGFLGIILWFLFWFPQGLFYSSAFVLWLSYLQKEESKKKIMIYLIFLVLAIGIYIEVYMGIPLLQSFLQTYVTN